MIDPITASLGKPAGRLAELLLKPLIEMAQKEVSKGFQLAYHAIFNSYRDYIISAFDRHSYFQSIVFKNEQKKLEDYYLPLTILKHSGEREVTINQFPRELINDVERILIVDSAGMGKTTILKYIFLCCVKETAGIPIYIELRKLSEDRSILDFIREELASLADIEKTDKLKLLFKLLETGEFIFLLNGYDEIPADKRDAVTSGLQSFIHKAPLNKYIITSREETGLLAFSAFQRFTIKPLEKGEAYSLLRKYDDDNRLTDTLISRLDKAENEGIHEFLTNPFLTSLLYKSLKYKQIVPLKKHIFYRQVFEALYETHDLTKDGGEYQRKKISGMDIDKFDQILRVLGILTYKKDKVEFTKDELLEFIDNVKKSSSDIEATSSSILHDLTHAIPLMVEEENYIRWSHKSIQEYFAAQYICRNTYGKQKEILCEYLRSEDFIQHINLISLCADIDAGSFKHSIAKELAGILLNEYDSLYKDNFSGIPIHLVTQRKCLTVGKETFLTRIDSFKGDNNISAEYQGVITTFSVRSDNDSDHINSISQNSIPGKMVKPISTRSSQYGIDYDAPGNSELRRVATQIQQLYEKIDSQVTEIIEKPCNSIKWTP